jgi:multicomponent Na+:H+ antiporter subunit D
VVGVLFAAGGLLLAALPPLTTFQGKALLDEAAHGAGYGWLAIVFVVVSALTGGAVLRVAGRVWLGWGPTEGPDPAQERAAQEPVDETRDARDHTPLAMIVVPAALLALAAAVGLIPGAVPSIARMAARFTDHAAYPAWVLHAIHLHWPIPASSHVQAEDVAYGVAAVLGALAVAGLGLFGRPLRTALPDMLTRPATVALHGLRLLHSGHIGDYIAWWTAGASVLGGVCLLALT